MALNSREQLVSALLVGSYERDRLLVHEIFHRLGWRLFEARDRKRAMECLRRNPVQVVITETDVPQWNWRHVLHDLRELAKPPQLIVTSPHADDYLWAEALNIGAYDVLPRPFQRDEVERVIASARRHFDFAHLRESTSAVVTAAGAA
jgi:DNA-binding NtrC family response regulator